jgi:hypothetical protein
METTERGFDIYARITDTYGTEIRVQESSSAEEPRVWLFVSGENSAHLNREQVERLIAALNVWMERETHAP